MRFSFSASLLFCVLTASFSSQHAMAQGSTDDEIEAIWHVQSLPFNFRGGSLHFSCSTFQNKLQAILEAVGAHPYMIVQASCNPSAVVGRVDARIALATPVPATPENIAAATKYDSRRELVARIRKTPLPSPAAIEKFSAVYRTIVLEDVKGLHLEPLDCQLLIAIKEQLLPKLNIEVEKSPTLCADDQPRLQTMQVRALIRVDDGVETPDPR